MQSHAKRSFNSRLALQLFLQDIRAYDTGKVTEYGQKVYHSRNTRYYMVIETGLANYIVSFYKECPC